MKTVIRAAGIGFGGTIGAGAAIILGGALVAVLTRSAITRSMTDLTEQLFGSNRTAEPETAERCNEAFGGGQGPCIRDKGHPGPHVDYVPKGYDYADNNDD